MESIWVKVEEDATISFSILKAYSMTWKEKYELNFVNFRAWNILKLYRPIPFPFLAMAGNFPA